MPNPMIPIYETLGGPWLLAAEAERALEADDDDAAEMRADDDRYQRRYGDD